MTWDEWLATNEPEPPTGFECIGNERMRQVWNASSEAERRRLEQQVGALFAGRERMGDRIRKLREFIASNCPHASLETNCPTCEFLMKDALS